MSEKPEGGWKKGFTKNHPFAQDIERRWLLPNNDDDHLPITFKNWAQLIKENPEIQPYEPKVVGNVLRRIRDKTFKVLQKFTSPLPAMPKTSAKPHTASAAIDPFNRPASAPSPTPDEEVWYSPTSPKLSSSCSCSPLSEDLLALVHLSGEAAKAIRRLHIPNECTKTRQADISRCKFELTWDLSWKIKGMAISTGHNTDRNQVIIRIGEIVDLTDDDLFRKRQEAIGENTERTVLEANEKISCITQARGKGRQGSRGRDG